MVKYKFCFILKLLLLLMLLQSCGGGDSSKSIVEDPPVPPPPSGERDILTVDSLMGTSDPGVINNDYYQPHGELATPSNSFCGTLHFQETQMSTTHPDSDWKGAGQTLFPAFSIPIVTRDGWMIPLQRDLILSGHGAGGDGNSLWNVIINPGQVWEEISDSGYTRVMFAFTLTDNFVGQARNGLASFIFNAYEVSSVAIQITQETAPVSDYERTDFSALVPVIWDSDCPSDVEVAITEFESERLARLPLHPWSELANATSTQATSRQGFVNSDFSALALLMDGELYQQDISTRSGLHPTPQWMRHGVFSVNKTMGLGISMLYLAGRYGDSIFHELITDYVPELAAHPGWQNVTFHHTLNMVTGTIGADSGRAISPFIQARSATSRITAIAELSDDEPAPGEQFAYYSTHSFVLSYAMNNYVKQHEGPTADYWSMVEENVLEPIGIFHLPISRSSEDGDDLGVPIMGWGSYPDVDAAAKIAQLFQDDGLHNGQQLLSLSKTRETMRRSGQTGYASGHPNERYLHSMWTVQTNTGGCSIDVPIMSGFGGNHVMMLPSGLSMIRFMDANDYEVQDTVRAAEYYRSSC